MLTKTDTQAMVHMCLNCPWPDCIDCLAGRNAYAYAIRLELKTKGAIEWATLPPLKRSEKNA